MNADSLTEEIERLQVSNKAQAETFDAIAKALGLETCYADEIITAIKTLRYETRQLEKIIELFLPEGLTMEQVKTIRQIPYRL